MAELICNEQDGLQQIVKQCFREKEQMPAWLFKPPYNLPLVAF